MPHVTIRLEVDPTSRRRTVVVSYESDVDALPNEHEEEHKAMVKKLIEGGILAEGDGLRVEREGVGAVGGESTAQEDAQRAARKA